jgi:hypothetical protein
LWVGRRHYRFVPIREVVEMPSPPTLRLCRVNAILDSEALSVVRVSDIQHNALIHDARELDLLGQRK